MCACEPDQRPNHSQYDPGKERTPYDLPGTGPVEIKESPLDRGRFQTLQSNTLPKKLDAQPRLSDIRWEHQTGIVREKALGGYAGQWLVWVVETIKVRARARVDSSWEKSDYFLQRIGDDREIPLQATPSRIERPQKAEIVLNQLEGNLLKTSAASSGESR